MARWVILLLFAVVVIAEDDSDVVVLDADNFDAGIKGKPIMLVEFYAPWSVLLLFPRLEYMPVLLPSVSVVFF